MLPMGRLKGNVDPPYQRDGERWTIEDCLLHLGLIFDPQLSGPVSARREMNRPTSLDSRAMDFWKYAALKIEGVGGARTSTSQVSDSWALADCMYSIWV